jgi:predicted aspartyl protease
MMPRFSRLFHVPFVSACRIVDAGRALLLLVALGTAASADVVDKDAPPPPGTLLQELNSGPALSDAATVLGAPMPLSAPVEIPFQIEGGHMLIEASINGGAKQTFLFDTGGRLVLTPEAAGDLKSLPGRQAMMAGIGPTITKVSIVTVDRLTAAIAELPNWIVDRGSKPRLAGLIGPELITRRIVTIDYRKRMMTLHPSGQVRPGPNAIVSRLGFSVSPEGLGHLSVRASIGDVEGEMLIDTGATGGVFLNERFITAHNPFRPGGKTIRFFSPGGVGGLLQMQAGIGTTFRLGTAVFNAPLIHGPVSQNRHHRCRDFIALRGYARLSVEPSMVRTDCRSETQLRLAVRRRRAEQARPFAFRSDRRPAWDTGGTRRHPARRQDRHLWRATRPQSWPA